MLVPKILSIFQGKLSLHCSRITTHAVKGNTHRGLLSEAWSSACKLCDTAQGEPTNFRIPDGTLPCSLETHGDEFTKCANNAREYTSVLSQACPALGDVPQDPKM